MSCWVGCPREGCDGDLRIRVGGTPGTPNVWYLPNGDPGYPGDPPEVWVEEVLEASCGHEFSDAELEALADDEWEILAEHLADALEAAEDRYWEDRFEAWRDQQRGIV